MDQLKTRYRIEGMDCGGCAAKIETAVRRCDGVTEVSVSVAGHSMVVEHGPKTDLASLTNRVKGLGYGITEAGASLPEADNDHAEHSSTQHDKGHGSPGHVHDHGEPIQGPWLKTTKARLMLASGAAFALALIISQIAPGLWAVAFHGGDADRPHSHRATRCHVRAQWNTILNRDADDDHGHRRRVPWCVGRGRGSGVPVSRRRTVGGGRGGQGARQHPGFDQARSEDRLHRIRRRRR